MVNIGNFYPIMDKETLIRLQPASIFALAYLHTSFNRETYGNMRKFRRITADKVVTVTTRKTVFIRNLKKTT